MEKENAGDAPSAPTTRVRHRKRSSDVDAGAGKPNGSSLLVNDSNKYKRFSFEHTPLSG